MPRFSSAIWCARWSDSRFSISGERTGRVTTRYISLPRNLSVSGCTSLFWSAMIVSWRALLALDAGLVGDVDPARDMRPDLVAHLVRRAAVRDAAEAAQALLHVRQRDHATDLLVELVDHRPRHALRGGDADPGHHLVARRHGLGDGGDVRQRAPAL